MYSSEGSRLECDARSASDDASQLEGSPLESTREGSGTIAQE